MNAFGTSPAVKPAPPEPVPDSLVGRELRVLTTIFKQAKGAPEPDQHAAASALIDHLASPNFSVRGAVLACLRGLGAVGIAALNARLIRDEISPVTAPAMLCLGALAHAPNSTESTEHVGAIATVARRLHQQPGGPLVDETWQAAYRALSYLGSDDAVTALAGQLRAAPAARRPAVIEALALCENLGAVKRHSTEVWDALRTLTDLHPRRYLALAAPFAGPAISAENLISPWFKHLAVGCGYIDQPPGVGDAALAAECVNRVGVTNKLLMAELAQAADRDTLLAKWERRVSAFAHATHAYDTWEQDALPVLSLNANVEGQIDRTLFFAALRSVDEGNLVDKRRARPFDYRHLYQGTLVYLGVSQNHFFNAELPAAIADARDVVKTEALLPFAVQERLVNRYETRAEDSCQNANRFVSKWRALDRMIVVDSEDRPRTRPDFQSALARHHAPWAETVLAAPDVNFELARFIAPLVAKREQALWRFAVLDPGVEAEHAEFLTRALPQAQRVMLSLGARAAASLKAYRLLSSGVAAPDAEWADDYQLLVEGEWASRALKLGTIGFEAQDITTPRGLVPAWKEALKHLGIVSAERPEFYSTLEAAFPPAFSAEALGRGLRDLLGIGFCADPSRGFMLHLSTNAAIGEEGRFIAAALMSHSAHFGAPVGEPERWRRSIAKLFSKGFIHENRESLDPLTGAKTKEPHLEIRAVHLASPSGSRDELAEHGTALFRAVQLLSFAAASDAAHPAAAEWRAFKEEVTAIFSEGALGAIPFLTQPWLHQGTGDARDMDMIRSHPLVQAFEALQTALAGDERLREDVRARLQAAIRTHCDRIRSVSVPELPNSS